MLGLRGNRFFDKREMMKFWKRSEYSFIFCIFFLGVDGDVVLLYGSYKVILFLFVVWYYVFILMYIIIWFVYL